MSKTPLTLGVPVSIFHLHPVTQEGTVNTVLSSFKSILTDILKDMPEVVTMVTDFLWKCRWFIVGGLVLIGVYQLVMVVLPYLMWYFLSKLIISTLLSILF